MTDLPPFQKMLKQHELAAYLSSLPKDAFLVHRGRKYGLNRGLFMTLSGLAKTQLQTGGNEVTLDIEDQHGNIPLVIDFLNGKKIDITSENDVELQELADALQILPLRKLAEESIKAPMSMTNIFHRINRTDPDHLDNFDDFLRSHARELILDDRVFSLPVSCLKILIESDEVMKFDDKWKFIFECWKRFPQHACELHGSEEHMKNIPEDALAKLISSPEYADIDGNIPSWVIVESLQNELSKEQSHCQDLTKTITDLKEEIDRVQQERLKAHRERRQADLPLTEQDPLNQFWTSMGEIATDCITLAPYLDQFTVTDNTIDEIDAVVQRLLDKCERVKVIVRNVQAKKIVFHELTKNGGRLAQELSSLLNSMRQLLVRIKENGSDMNDIIQELRVHARELQTMSIIALRPE